MEFSGIPAQHARLNTQIRDAIDRVLTHQQFVGGPEVAELEARLCEATGAAYCVTTSSGTMALLLALMAHGADTKTTVFTTPLTFAATIEPALLLGCKMELVDVDPHTLTIDPFKLRPYNHPGYELLISVDLFGRTAAYDALSAASSPFTGSLPLIADAAQSYGATYKGRKVGTLADCTCLSFYPSKPLATCGDGGAILTNHPFVAEMLLALRNHGQVDKKYQHEYIGINGRLDTLKAAVLLAKLPYVDEERYARREHALAYRKALENYVDMPGWDEGSAFHAFPILSDKRDSIKKALTERGIPSAIYYPEPLHLQPAYLSLGYGEGDFPVVENVCKTILCLPIHAYLTRAERGLVITAVFEGLA